MAHSDQLPRASSRFSKFFRSTSTKIKSRISRSAKPDSSGSQYPSLPDGLYRRFSLAEIKAATNNFRHDSLIGHGGFGRVYKGVMDNGSLIVAVKRMTPRSSLKQEVSVFRTEVLLLCQLRHPHIIALIGLCVEDGERILVYEYMSNGGLDRHLYGTVPVPWKQRLEICIGAARGLHYLHTGVKYVVIHRDVKTTNILIDDKWGARISDFGLSKLGPSSVSSKPLVFKKDPDDIVGTLGYLAPEYCAHGEMSTKCDVYSFGVVLLEVLTGRRVWDGNVDLVSWSGENIESGSVYEIVDPFLRGKVAPECLKRFLEITGGCLAMEADERPMIGEVEATLELVLEVQNKADADMESINPNRELGYKEEPFDLPDFRNLVKWSRFKPFGSPGSTDTQILSDEAETE